MMRVTTIPPWMKMKRAWTKATEHDLHTLVYICIHSFYFFYDLFNNKKDLLFMPNYLDQTAQI